MTLWFGQNSNRELKNGILRHLELDRGRHKKRIRTHSASPSPVKVSCPYRPAPQRPWLGMALPRPVKIKGGGGTACL